MKIEIDADIIDMITANNLLGQFNTVADYICRREDGKKVFPMYSSDIDEDLKKARKLQKALKAVYNYNVAPQDRL